MRRRSFLLLILGCIISIAAPVFAQEDLDEIYVAPDDSFEFLYPSDWEVDDSQYEDSGFVSLFGEIGRDAVSLNFLSPFIIDALDPGARDVEEASEALEDIIEFDNFDIYDLDDGRQVGVGTFELDDDAGSGLLFIMEFSDEGFGIVLVFAEDPESFEDEDFFGTILNVVLTFNNVGENGTSGGGDEDEDDGGDEPSGDFPDELSDFDGDWQDAIAELEDEGVIAAGGALIFNENSVFLEDVGAQFTSLASDSPRRDIVMAATLEFTADGREFESCGIMARIEDGSGEVVDTFLQVGITNDGEVFYTDASGGEADEEFADLDLDLDDPHHILFIAQRDRLWVYVDGELVFDNVRIEDRSGYYGIAFLGQASDSRCEGTNIWAYDVPALVSGICEAVASGTINKRTGPGTNFDRAGTMSAGERIEVVGQAEDGDGFTWYELDDDTWVREDVVSLQGDCTDIPESD